MIDQNTRARRIRRPKDLQDRFEVVNAFEELHSNSRLGQVLAPHVLHELGVMTTLHPDARALGNLGATRRGGERSGVRDAASRRADLRAGRGPGRGRARRQRLNGTTLQPKTGAERERTTRSSPILQLHEVNTARLFHARHGADPTGGDILQDHTDLDMDCLRSRTPRPRPVAMRVMGEDVATVGI